MTWYVYIVRCRNNALYTGITNDLRGRVQKHNEGRGARSVVAHGLPVELAYFEEKKTKSEALKREREIKNLNKQQKEELVGR